MFLRSLDGSMPAGHALARQPAPYRQAGASVRRHGQTLPMRVGTRGSPLALWQTRHFLSIISALCPVLRDANAFEEHEISCIGDRIQDQRLADIGGKGLFSKEIHEALLDGRVDFAVHSLKDLETEMPPGVVLACMLRREDARDAIILGEECTTAFDPEDPYAGLPLGMLVGTASVRRQSQLLYARPDLRVEVIRGNVQSRLGKVRSGQFGASLLAIAGLRRLEMEHEAGIILDPEVMVPAAGQGIVGVTVRAKDVELHEMLTAIEDPTARTVATAERALLGALDGSCRTPIGAYGKILPNRDLQLTGLVARADGSFLLKKTMVGCAADAERMGQEMGEELRIDSPSDVFG